MKRRNVWNSNYNSLKFYLKMLTKIMIRDPTFSSSSVTYKAIIKRELKVWNEGPMNNLPMNEHTFMAWKVIHTATLPFRYWGILSRVARLWVSLGPEVAQFFCLYSHTYFLIKKSLPPAIIQEKNPWRNHIYDK